MQRERHSPTKADSLKSELTGNRRLTPMLEQYLEAKSVHPDGVLMFRMGDFFEMFFEDAKIAARELDLVLTSRDKDKGEAAIPMAGVPHHAVTSYIARLVDRGHTVVLCDQVEDPREAKGIVKREVTRIVTPGTVSDLESLDPSAPSYLAVATPLDKENADFGVALLDLLAGEILTTECGREVLGDELRRMGVRELRAPALAYEAIAGLVGSDALTLKSLEDDAWPGDAEARSVLSSHFDAAVVGGIESRLPPGVRQALAALIGFAERTQRRSLPHLLAPRAYRRSETLVLDDATRRNLELLRTQLDGEKRGSLLWHLDRCRTAIGSRLLGHWVLFPLRDAKAIEARLDVVSMLASERALREALRTELEGIRDIERLLGRIALGRATPRDLGALRSSLAQVPSIRSLLEKGEGALAERWRALDDLPALRHELEKALVDEPPQVATDGGIFRRGFQADLDDLIALSTESHGFLLDLEQRERKRTGITNLKVRYNRVFGYYIEVTRANLGQVPEDYVRKQTLVGAERFITDELKTFEEKVLSADERRKRREAELFEALVAEVAAEIPRLRLISRLVAETDALASLGQVGDEGRYVRPEIVREARLEVEEGRHPVLERLMPGGERFVPNDLRLDASSRQLMVLTGPNMAGKSTMMRQAALIALLAHVGSLVPAKRAVVGLCDRIFTRVGAADSLGKGLSTFMVEMLETATILQHATPESLVILDEIGRGTSTFDGVSIAWAVAEHLHDHIGCRTMFATHYHELTDLALERERIFNAQVAVKEHNGRIVFLRRLEEGAANRSYGIQVARLAGLPEELLKRAREILANLERGELDEHGLPAIAFSASMPSPDPQLQLFARPARTPPRIEAELRSIDPLHLTPMQALELVARLKGMLDDEGEP